MRHSIRSVFLVFLVLTLFVLVSGLVNASSMPILCTDGHSYLPNDSKIISNCTIKPQSNNGNELTVNVNQPFVDGEPQTVTWIFENLMNETMRTTSRSTRRAREVSDMAGAAWKSATRNVSFVIPCELHLANTPAGFRRQVR